MGKHSDPSEFKLDARDMVPLVYQETMKVDPLINQLQREYEDIMRQL